MDYNLDDPQDLARFQVNLMLSSLDSAMREGLSVVRNEDVPRDVALKLLALRNAITELDRVTQPGHAPTLKDIALHMLGGE